MALTFRDMRQPLVSQKYAHVSGMLLNLPKRRLILPFGLCEVFASGRFAGLGHMALIAGGQQSVRQGQGQTQLQSKLAHTAIVHATDWAGLGSDTMTSLCPHPFRRAA